jgi:putative inorganic carbon (hco3(-)) transporter
VAGLIQFAQRRREANAYAFLLDGRITGLASHWMTFGAEEMIIMLIVVSFVLFSHQRSVKLLGWPILGVMLAAVTLGMTRSIFLLGVPAGLGYLLWRRRPILVAVATAAIMSGIAMSPEFLRERAISVFRPHGDMDSNAHRAVCRLTGWEMVKTHPWLGLGPEQIGKQFNSFVPATVVRPLPHGWYGHLHNLYLQYAAERGLGALFAMLWFIGKIALDFQKRLRTCAIEPDGRAVLHGAIAVIVAILAEGMLEYNLGDSEVLTLFLSVVAIGYVVLGNIEETSGCAN